MDGSMDIGAVRSGLLDEKVVARASTSFGRSQANLLYRVLLAVSQGDAAMLAAYRRDPVFQELLTKSLTVRNGCESKKVARKRVVLTEAIAKDVDACILRFVRKGDWLTKTAGGALSVRRLEFLLCRFTLGTSIWLKLESFVTARVSARH